MVGANSASNVVIQGNFDSVQNCTTDRAHSVLKRKSKLQCSLPCMEQCYCREYTFDETTKDCSLYYHKPVYTEETPGCYRYKARLYHC